MGRYLGSKKVAMSRLAGGAFVYTANSQYTSKELGIEIINAIDDGGLLLSSSKLCSDSACPISSISNAKAGSSSRLFPPSHRFIQLHGQ